MATGLIVPLVSQALGGIKDIIGEFHMSPEDKAKLEQAIADRQAAAEQRAADLEIKLNDIAGQNIRADAQSGDKYTERARPTFMYIVEFILGFNYIGLPFLHIWFPTAQTLVLPGDLLVLFGTCVTGYVMARTADKVSSMPGASTVSVLGGLIKTSQVSPTPNATTVASVSVSSQT